MKDLRLVVLGVGFVGSSKLGSRTWQIAKFTMVEFGVVGVEKRNKGLIWSQLWLVQDSR
jgi:hypothetical protein